MRLAETGQKIGFISPLTRNFCEGCNRVRMTCTGMLYMCLGQDDHADLRAVVREAMIPPSLRRQSVKRSAANPGVMNSISRLAVRQPYRGT